MTDLEKALADIDAIRAQVARSAEFRGYGVATIAGTGGLAMAVAAGQAVWLADAAASPGTYLVLWTATAAVALIATVIEAVNRSRRLHTTLAPEMVQSAAEQFLPALGAGALLTAVVWQFSPGIVWTLPGIWQVLFGIGIFASVRFLPRRLAVAGGWYIFTGAACLAFASGTDALTPWAMGVPFGIGQLMVAGILWHHGRTFHGED